MKRETLVLAEVDDDADVRVALTRLVSPAVFAVESVASGAEFLCSVENHGSDCLISDMGMDMSEMSGSELQGAPLTRGEFNDA